MYSTHKRFLGVLYVHTVRKRTMNVRTCCTARFDALARVCVPDSVLCMAPPVLYVHRYNNNNGLGNGAWVCAACCWVGDPGLLL